MTTRAARCSELIDQERRMLYNFYVWPYKESSFFYKFVGIGHLLISFTALFVNCGFTYMAAKQGFGSFVQTIDFLFIHLTALAYVVKVSVFMAKRDILLNLQQLMEHPLFNPIEVEYNACIKDALTKAGILRFLYYYPSRTTLCLVIMLPIMAPDQVGDLTFPFPMDMRTCSLLSYVCVYIYQILFLITNGFCLFAFDIIICMFIYVGIVQFEILNKKLEVASRVIEDYGKSDSYVKEVLDDFVAHHYLVVDYVENLEDMFSYGILAQFLSNYTGLGISGFTIVVTPLKSLVVTIAMGYVVTALVEIGMVCYFGNELTYQSSILGDSCYGLNWNNYLPNTNKIIYIIMERTKRPMELTAGKFFTLSYKTFLNIVQTAFSYVTVLEGFYDGEGFG